MNKELDIKNFYRISDNDKTVYIDISIDFYREIYNVWDFSPLINRDLDDDLFEYLEACAFEIPRRYKIKIIFHIPRRIVNPEKQEKSIKGYYNFFRYKLRKLKKKKQSANRQMLIYGLLGLFLILSAIVTEHKLPDVFLLEFISEGFYIGGWVLFWELFSTLFFKRKDFRDEEFMLTRLLESEIVYEVRE